MQPTFEGQLADHFRERLHEQSESLDPSPHEDTLWYMGNMLARFGDSRQFFSFEEGTVRVRPLAMLYFDAQQARSESERCLILRQLGDMALFLGALFPEKYARRGIRKDYFVGMGGSAYDYLSANAAGNRHIFSELAHTFTRMLELVARVCARETCFDATDVLALYERWRRTGDPRLLAQLRAAGVDVPVDNAIH